MIIVFPLVPVVCGLLFIVVVFTNSAAHYVSVFLGILVALVAIISLVQNIWFRCIKSKLGLVGPTLCILFDAARTCLYCLMVYETASLAASATGLSLFSRLFDFAFMLLVGSFLFCFGQFCSSMTGSDSEDDMYTGLIGNVVSLVLLAVLWAFYKA